MNNELKDLVAAISSLKNESEVTAFLSDLLTKSEIETISMRLKVAKMLDKGSPYKEIEKVTGASSATIAKINEYLKYGYNGYRTVMERI